MAALRNRFQVGRSVSAWLPPGMSAYQSLVLSDTPLAYWKLDETSGITFADSTGNSRSLTMVNSPTLNQTGPGATQLPKAAAFTLATQNYGSASYVSPFNIAASSSWSIEGWIKVASAPPSAPYTMAAWNWDTSAPSVATFAVQNSTGYLYASLYDSGGSSFTLANTASVCNNAWRHVALTATSGGALNMYLDGSNVATTSTARYASASTNYGQSVGARIRYNLGSPTYDWYSTSTIAAVAFYTKTLTAAQILQRYQTGSV